MAARQPFRPAFTAGLALAAGLTASACGRGGSSDTPPGPRDLPVARVDGRTVWASDVRREAAAQGLIGRGDKLEPSSDLFGRVLAEVVDQKLLAAEALKRGLDKDPDAQRRLSAARDRVLGDVLVERVVAGAVSENAVRGLYEEQLKLAKRSDEIRARQIVSTTRAEAEAVRKMLAAGAEFEALALQRSRDAATRLNGGDLGWFTPDVMPPAYAAALEGARPGALVGPFEVEGGWAILKVEGRRPQQPLSLEAARPQIVRFLTYDQIRDLLEKLRTGAKVELLVKPDNAAARPPVEKGQP